MSTKNKKVEKIVNEFFKKMGFPILHISRQDNFLNVEVSDPSLLIGRDGMNLSVIQFMLKRIIYHQEEDFPQFTLDINNYRQDKLKSLKKEAKEVADEVRLLKKPISLRPMSSYERRIIHITLSDQDGVITESKGDGKNRAVVVKPV